MIDSESLRVTQDHIMDAMTALYHGGKDDPLAQELAGALVMIYEDIDIELLERAF